MPEATIVLASGSPRRRELIGLGGWEVDIRPAGVDESPRPAETAERLTRRLADAKADAARLAPGEVVLAADTVVADGAQLLGKPADQAEAGRMLERLSGRTHRVITSITLRAADGRVVHDSCELTVPMRAYDDLELRHYLASGDSLDKAGGYGIQDGRFDPVDRESLEGCFANVMGLPVCHVVRNLRRLGVEPARDVPAACRELTGYACRVYPSILQEKA